MTGLIRTLTWYFRRLSAMELTEVFGHLRRNWASMRDSARGTRVFAVDEPPRGAYPGVRLTRDIPGVDIARILEEADEIIAGRVTLFQEIRLSIDSPPKWQRDYLSGCDISDRRPFRFLNHRHIVSADIKVIWDLNRWSQLVRLAQACFLSEKREYGDTVIRWLEDWLRENPPFRGWNWTSALEAAIRLIHFAWIEALLGDRIHGDLRNAIVSSHARYTWRFRSFGSSANNHWLGEIAALIVAACRWRLAERDLPNLDVLRDLLEDEILLQFAGDGGSREQAFHYHIFALELVLHAYFSLLSVGVPLRSDVVERIESAVSFAVNFRSPGLGWDFGDSDNAVLVPIGDRVPFSGQRLIDWLARGSSSEARDPWLGSPPFSVCGRNRGWFIAEESGYAVSEDDEWFVRVDGSPLGYLSIAAHGHLDALHSSFWFRGRALIVDPGTGAYHFDEDARERLAGERSHNGPVVEGYPLAKRKGVFMWAGHHPPPSLELGRDDDAIVEIEQRHAVRTRRLRRRDKGWVIEDRVQTPRTARVSVTWIFEPGIRVEEIERGTFRLDSGDGVLCFRVDRAWEQIRLETALVSPSFRVLAYGAAINLVGLSNGPRPYVTILDSLE